MSSHRQQHTTNLPLLCACACPLPAVHCSAVPGRPHLTPPPHQRGGFPSQSAGEARREWGEDSLPSLLAERGLLAVYLLAGWQVLTAGVRACGQRMSLLAH